MRGLVIIMFALAACDSASSSAITFSDSLPAPIAAEATAQYAAADAQIAQAQQSYEQSQAAYRATLEASQQFEATRTAVQATLDASAIAEAARKVEVADLSLMLAREDLQLRRIEVVSATHALTTAQIVQAQTAQTAQARANDWMWNAPEYIGHAVAPLLLCGLALLVLYAGYVIVRAGAARISGDHDRAMLVLGVPAPLLLNPPTLDNEEENQAEHGGNTETREHAQTRVNTAHFTGTLEEYGEYTRNRAAVIRLLTLARDYFTAHPESDPKQIPHYKKLNVKPEWRGEAANVLERSGLVIVKQGGIDQGTFVLPPYQSVDDLLEAIALHRVTLKLNTLVELN